jgi:hypothetical protein
MNVLIVSCGMKMRLLNLITTKESNVGSVRNHTGKISQFVLAAMIVMAVAIGQVAAALLNGGDKMLTLIDVLDLVTRKYARMFYRMEQLGIKPVSMFNGVRLTCEGILN